MWPFRKKAVEAHVGESQDFTRTYVPRAPLPIQNPIDAMTVCPLCLNHFPPGSVSSDYPVCTDCSSEGIDSLVQPISDYLASKTPEDFDDMLARWEAADGFRPEYKALKSKRIMQFKALKLGGC